MIMRVSTNQAFESSTTSILQQQSELLRTQQQLSSGRRITSPSDDPIGAARAIELSSGKMRNDQYLANQTVARNSLSFAEGTLTSVVDEIQNVRSLLVSAGDGAYGDAERRSIAAELRVRREHLLALANTRDADGRYVFAGFQEKSQPFVQTPAGVLYNGDSGVRAIQVADSRQMPVSLNGSAIFERIPEGNGVFLALAEGTNAGNGVISIGRVSDATALDGQTYRLAFHVTAGVTTYDVLDASSAVISAGNAWKSGDAVTVAGMQVEITGTPADGDAFSLAPSANRNIFDALQDAIAVLEAGTGSAAARACLSMGLARALSHTDRGLEQVMLARTASGTGLKELDSLEGAAQTTDEQIQGELSAIQDLDYAQAISDLTRRQTMVEAAQKAFVKVMGNSLFDLL
jgi:flagellar hook-associated protein 3 FlgL